MTPCALSYYHMTCRRSLGQMTRLPVYKYSSRCPFFSCTHSHSFTATFIMYSRVIMNNTEQDIRKFEKETFIRFRKSLKKLGVDEFYKCFGTACADNKIKKVLMSIRKRAFFDGHIIQYKCIMNKEAFAQLLADTVFTMFRILCSMSTEFDVRSAMRSIAGVVNDVPRGTNAMERIIHVMNVIHSVAEDNEIFIMIQGAITQLGVYASKQFGIDFSEYDSDSSE